MVNVLIVEDDESFQDYALYGIAEAVGDEDWDIFDRSTSYEIDRFRIQVVSCMRDAWEYLQDNTNGKLITILDGYFPPIIGGDEKEMYWHYLGELDKLRANGENFLLPYSSSNRTNSDMITRFEDLGTVLKTDVPWQKAKTQEAIKNGIRFYNENCI